MPTAVAIVNPKSARGKAADVLERVRKHLPPDLEVWKTQFRGHGIELTAAALNAGAKLIVAVGGDGTINEVVNGFFDEDVAPSEASLGIIPQGTASDFRRSLDLPADENEAAFIIGNGIPRTIDAMRVRYTTHDGQPAVRYAMNVTSFGMGGLVAARANRSSKALGGKASFLISTGITTLEYSGKPVHVTLDENETIDLRISNVVVGNGRFHGGGMLVCPEARIDDGLLDVTVIAYLNLLEIAASIRQLYNGTILQHPKVQSHRARRIRAESTETTAIEIDGESVGRLPIEVEILPKALHILA